MAKALYCFIGFLLAIIRITEPYLFQELKFQFNLLISKISNGILFCCYKLRGNKNKNFELFYEKDYSIRNSIPNSKYKKVKFQKDELCSFLNSAMNIEFVYLILLGITNFMESTSQFQDHLNFSQSSQN